MHFILICLLLIKFVSWLYLEHPCDTAPCLNGGSCFSVDTDYKCLCVDGYTGVNCSGIRSLIKIRLIIIIIKIFFQTVIKL